MADTDLLVVSRDGVKYKITRAELDTYLGAGYKIDNSLRFNASDSANLSRTPTVSSNRKTWTWSGWVKLGTLTGTRTLFGALTSGYINGYFNLVVNSSNGIEYDVTTLSDSSDRAIRTTTAVFRDPSAWYHIVLKYDVTQTTDTNRVMLYVNGENVIFTTAVVGTYPALNTDGPVNSTIQHQLGFRNVDNDRYYDGYQTEVNLIDGQALEPTDFGKTNEFGVWVPKAYRGTYGTNGFYLQGQDSADLGKDTSGNDNNFTNTNVEQVTDVPTLTNEDTANFATINPNNSFGAATIFSNGNLDFFRSSQVYGGSLCSMAIKSKTYFEVTLGSSIGTNRNSYCGVGSSGSANDYTPGNYFGFDSIAWSLGISTLTAFIANNNVYTAQAGAITVGDVFMYAVDPENGSIWFGCNGTWYSGNPSTGTGASYTNLPSEVFPVVQGYNSGTHSINFGQQPFAYTPPTDFKKLNTFNLPDSAIKDGNEYFNPVLYNGTGEIQNITGVGFQPDFTIVKSRNQVASHNVYDAVRGIKEILITNDTASEVTEPDNAGLDSFDSDGFTIGAIENFANVNISGGTYVAWNWKANGTGVLNEEGTIDSQVSANPTAGFSVVTYTGTGSVSTVGHGLNDAPKVLIGKNRTYAVNWRVYHESLGATKYLMINSANGSGTNILPWNNTAPTSTVFTIGTSDNVNRNTDKIVMYCFAEVEGYSKFGSYTGNGSADGPFVYTGFKPAYVMVKYATGTGSWLIYDDARAPVNSVGNILYADTTAVENPATNRMDFVSNGIKLRTNDTSHNANGQTYIYMAFAENPFKNSTAR